LSFTKQTRGSKVSFNSQPVRQDTAISAKFWLDDMNRFAYVWQKQFRSFVTLTTANAFACSSTYSQSWLYQSFQLHCTKRWIALLARAYRSSSSRTHQFSCIW